MFNISVEPLTMLLGDGTHIDSINLVSPFTRYMPNRIYDFSNLIRFLKIAWLFCSVLYIMAVYIPHSPPGNVL